MSKQNALGAVLALALAASGCGNTTSSNSSCAFNGNNGATITTITKGTPSDANCPDLTAAQLQGSGSSDGGTSGCSPVIDNNACTLTFNCTMSGFNVTGSLKGTGNTASGSFTLSGSFGGTSLTCTYNLTATAK